MKGPISDATISTAVLHKKPTAVALVTQAGSRMTEFHRRTPHALATAHGKLIAALDEGIQQYQANLRYSNSHEVCRCIERFVDALYQHGGRDELRRRATLVETRCDPGSDYETARSLSLPSYRGQPRKLTGSKLAIGRLRKSSDTPLFLADVARERQDIERVLNEGDLNLNVAARQAYESWRSACRAVQRDAELLEVDGCWYLFQTHAAGEDVRSDRADCARAITQSDTGGANLESIKKAVDSLAGWARNNPPHNPDLAAQQQIAQGTLEAQARLAGREILESIIEAGNTAHRPGNNPLEPAKPTGAAECHVTLAQMAAIVNKSKRTLERLRDDKKLPAPAVKGGKGKADEWRWSDIRPILENKYSRPLPEVFPSDRFIRR